MPEPGPAETATGADADDLVDAAVSLVRDWVGRSESAQTRSERRMGAQLHGVVADPDGVAFAMGFVDRVVRPEDNRIAATQMRQLVRRRGLPGFLGPVDKVLLRAGAAVAPLLPTIVMPLARARMRALVGHLVVDAGKKGMASHLERRRTEGFRLNVNLLGEAVLGNDEADRRLDEAARLLRQPDVDYVSVKVSAIVAQLNPWDHERNIDRVVDRLRPLFEVAAATEPPTFVNLDMEEYHDLELTLAAFQRLLSESAMHAVDAGIVLQAYLPDSFAALQQLVAWAHERHDRVVDGRPGGRIKVRLVKGANLAMENVEAAIRGWEPTTYATKAETDANYKRCLDWVLTAERTAAVKVGLASHNLFDVAWARLLSVSRGVPERVEFEMLQGMAPAQARTVQADGGGLLLYTPIVDPADFHVAISYLFRRLEENSSTENFIRHLFTLAEDPAALDAEAEKFRAAVRDRGDAPIGPRRRQNRSIGPPAGELPDGFVNEPDTDPALPANRSWAAALLEPVNASARSPHVTTTDAVDVEVAAAVAAQPGWAARPLPERRRVLHAIADELTHRRGDLVAAMIHEASKTVGEADAEVSEAIDFARYYGDRVLDLAPTEDADFSPLGVVCVVPPWNFPVAIPAGGVLAALAAGNAVVLKPAPETPRCAEIVAQCCGVGGAADVLRFARTPDGDIGRHLISHPSIDAVILTGAYETADLFRLWRPGIRIFAETSGKNATVITPSADLDLAVADLVASAFGHGGQKCSASSLAICVGDVYESERFRRQLADSVRSLAVGPAADAGTSVPPLIAPPGPKLARGLTQLEPGEEWLVEPRRIDDAGDRTWTPGVKFGVAEGSWFHQTECFGPVLGLMRAPDLDAAIRIQNGTAFGLTGGLHSLDPAEIDRWVDRVDVGNAYVNRTTTGAIVQRQPFGGWKRSSLGPGAKAGGPNYVAQLGRWSPSASTVALGDEEWLARAAASDAAAWAAEFGVDHDPTGLFCEANTFRYRPLPAVMIRVGPGAVAREVERLRSGAELCGVEVVESSDESSATAIERAVEAGAERIRVVGDLEPALRDQAPAAGIHLIVGPVTTEGRRELLTFVREQSVSRTLHRYGNLV
jgi:RHH-type proline utilization regulon transcriptional repressor/proline dehydrogenase/delta 1-pyrroline-5-carboxylate dehydrogenase